MSSKREIFISIDVETAGPIPGEFSLLSIGACDVDDDSRSFSIELKPINRNADAKALEVSGLSLEVLTLYGEEPSKAMKEFSQWIHYIAGNGAVPVFVGFNAPFDWSFINYYFHRYIGYNPFGFTALDIKALYMGATGCRWSDTRSSIIDKNLAPNLKGDHNALHDSKYQAELFRLVRKINSKREKEI